MKTVQKLGRLVLPLSLLALAACQTMPGDTTSTESSTTPSTTAPQPGSTASQEQEALQAARQGAPVAVFLADTEEQAGWRGVQIQSGMLYINPQPVITREDLVDVRAGTSRQGDGLLALGLSELGRKKVENITQANPNKRLALVVGSTMLAAPGYTTQVSTDQLVFGVGSEANATAAARAIAGAQETENGAAPAQLTPAATTN
jgi:preprotein translocase subunit SecD|tara:strand:- start:52386 stop:52994 length:609 start_codon:yes stop_codon:yes gene_type:complete